MVPEGPFDIVTFDCYGTLIDWEAGIREAFRRAAREAGVALDLDAALAAYAEIEPRVEAEEFRSYRDVLAETMRRVVARLGWELPGAGADLLAAGLPGWAPFADTNPALERLVKRGYRLGILSNVDDDLLDATCRHFTVPISLRVTAELVRSYKPAPPHFLRARQEIGAAPWLHAAQSFFHDIRPAGALGIPAAWINRKGQPLPAGASPPLRQTRDLTELADWLTV